MLKMTRKATGRGRRTSRGELGLLENGTPQLTSSSSRSNSRSSKQHRNAYASYHDVRCPNHDGDDEAERNGRKEKQVSFDVSIPLRARLLFIPTQSL